MMAEKLLPNESPEIIATQRRKARLYAVGLAVMSLGLYALFFVMKAINA